MDLIFSTSEINIVNAVFRLLLAFIAGGLIGLNREKYNKAAGFRTHILICIGSTLIMLISIYIPQEFMDFNGDAGRIAAQIVTGIGFLGAGAIIKLGDNVKGLTTAASIWVSAAIGMAVGAGMIWIAFASLIFVLFALIIMEKLERLLVRKKNFKLLNLQLKQPNAKIDPIERVLKAYKVMYDIQEVRQNALLGVVYVEISIMVDYRFPLEKFMVAFSEIPNLQEITVKNKA